jgi:hypothetical protein
MEKKQVSTKVEELETSTFGREENVHITSREEAHTLKSGSYQGARA